MLFRLPCPTPFTSPDLPLLLPSRPQSEKYVRQLREAADYIHHRLGDRAEVALVLGSGLSNFADELEDQTVCLQSVPAHLCPL